MNDIVRDSTAKLGFKVLKTTIATIFLCLLMNVSFGVLATIAGNLGLLNQIFNILLSVVMLFGILCDSGNKDINLQSFGKIKINYSRGFIAGLFSLIPFYVISLPVLIMKVVGSELFSSYLKVARLLNAPFTVMFQNIFIETEIQNVSYGEILLLFVIPIIFVLICGISYILGTKKISFGDKLIYKNK